jgi:GAF domain-containing protein
MSELDRDAMVNELLRPLGATSSQYRLAALLDSVMAISAGLELSEVLDRIVKVACELLGARYGALGVLGPDGRHLAEFVTQGITPREREDIGGRAHPA